ncbi:30S ribosomal protein S20 [Candidatus Roizmanbacteria bacterium]|nr:30S ribosomal protein S20 [Candidatus Roizmanbacteria bacterium]
MPIIKSAKKKLRQDRNHTMRNAWYKSAYEKALRALNKKGGNSKKLLQEAYSKIDKAAKRGVIDKKKAGRLKAKASKLVKIASKAVT